MKKTTKMMLLFLMIAAPVVFGAGDESAKKPDAQPLPRNLTSQKPQKSAAPNSMLYSSSPISCSLSIYADRMRLAQPGAFRSTSVFRRVIWKKA